MTPAAPRPAGRVWVVGLGPGADRWRTPEASDVLARATDLVGYGTYLDMAAGLAPGATRHASDNREEAARAAHALDLAAADPAAEVAVVSSGDPGVFAMAAAVLEQLDRPDADPAWAAVEVTVCPGVTAAQAAAAAAGAPLGHDFAVISLSDNLKPWELVERRLDACAAADLVVALYNPVSRHRPWQLGRALEVLAGHRAGATPVVLGRDVGRPGGTTRVTTLAELTPDQVDMRTVVVVGSSTTRPVRSRAGSVYTPRSHPGR
ncbi:MAG TPA: precorrin-3B C(17)-methyltransferase [Acidimicrobiales bacterium]|nr:precorrin-3B C(17)-methyltransferase [Acidimicrobiales bacterium]